MSFYASYFSYDSVLSYEYGLRISSDSDDISTVDSANVLLHTQEIYRRPKPYLLGVQQTPVLAIPVHITVDGELSANQSSAVSKWLFGQMNYKKLKVLQPDMMYIYYNCIFTEPVTERYGNIIRGYTCTMTCDSPFAWEYSQTTTASYSPNSYLINTTKTINNTADLSDYTYPSITFKMNVFGGGLSIINSSDANREFAFTGLDALEEITVDNDFQIITSSASANRLPDFNYKWLRYVPKVNNFIISGNISSLSFTHQFAKKYA